MSAKPNERRTDLSVFLHDEESRAAIPRSDAFRVLTEPAPASAGRVRNVFVLCSALEMREVADYVTTTNRRHQLRALFVRENADSSWLPQLFERANLRALRNTLVHSDLAVPRRVMTAWQHGAQDRLIANATVAERSLFVLTCAMETLEIPFDALPVLKRVPSTRRRELEVAEDGSYIHWPRGDVHLDLDAIRGALDPTWGDRALVARATFDRAYGGAIAAVRRRRGLRQRDIVGLSDRQVRRIEAGESATVEALRLFAQAHEMELAAYLDALAMQTGANRQATSRVPA